MIERHTQMKTDKPRRVNRHGKEIHAFLIRLDSDLYKRVYDRSHDTHISMAQIVREALLRYL